MTGELRSQVDASGTEGFSPGVLEKLADGAALTPEETRRAMSAIMAGSCPDSQIAAFLTALRMRGETVEELAAAATVMRDRMLAPPAEVPKGILDTCGTGGDGSSTFNISTATAIVVSACGVRVAKHGNRAVSSSSGSADVLGELGIGIDAGPQAALDSLRRIGLGFFFAPHWHPAMRHVAPVRRQLRFRTIFNLLGPLCNPVGADFQLIGAGRWPWADKLAEALALLGTRSATVVWSSENADEITLGSRTRAIRIENGRHSKLTWTADVFGLASSPIETLRVRSPQESAARIRGVLDGQAGPARDVVLANAAAALWTALNVGDLREGVAVAARAIDSGAARQRLAQLVHQTQAAPAQEPGHAH